MLIGSLTTSWLASAFFNNQVLDADLEITVSGFADDCMGGSLYLNLAPEFEEITFRRDTGFGAGGHMLIGMLQCGRTAVPEFIMKPSLKPIRIEFHYAILDVEQCDNIEVAKEYVSNATLAWMPSQSLKPFDLDKKMFRFVLESGA